MFEKDELFQLLRNYNVSIDEDYVRKYHEETINHVIRCSQIAKEFGLYLNLSKDDLNKLVECALLHDIGKFQLDHNILYKIDKLTDEEFKYIKSHTNLEGNFSKLDHCILDCIRYHHDNSVKTGYNKIDISTKHEFVKIISLIDAFDAMNNRRSYRAYKIPLSEILRELEQNIGKQFDLFYGHKFIEFILQTNVA